MFEMVLVDVGRHTTSKQDRIIVPFTEFYRIRFLQALVESLFLLQQRTLMVEEECWIRPPVKECDRTEAGRHDAQENNNPSCGFHCRIGGVRN